MERPEVKVKDELGVLSKIGIPAMHRGITPPRELGAVPPPPAPPEPPRSGPEPAPDKEEVQISRELVLEIDNYALRKRVVELEERAARMALSAAREKRQELLQMEQQLMMKVSAQVGKPVTGNFRLIDKEKGICVID